MKAQHHVVGIWISVGKSEVVASSQYFSSPACTVGGPAMVPANRSALQHPIHVLQWSLPQHVLCMPMCARRLHSAGHVDDLYYRIRQRFHVCSTTAYRLEALCELHPMDRTRVRIGSALRACFSRDCTCAARSPVPFILSKCMCGVPRTRAPCIKVSMQSLLYIT